MMEISILLGVVLILCGMGYHSAYQRWRAIADDLGLKVAWGGPLNHGGLKGTFRGMNVKVLVTGYPYNNSSRETRATSYRVKSRAVAAGLRISEEAMAAKLTKLVGAQDVEVGIESLDEAFIFKAKDPALACEVLRRSGVEGLLLEFRYKTTSMKLARGTLRLEFKEAHADYEIAAYIEKICGLLAMLSDEPPAAKTSKRTPDTQAVDATATPDEQLEPTQTEPTQTEPTHTKQEKPELWW